MFMCMSENAAESGNTTGKVGRSFWIGQIYSRVAVKEERSTNESLSLILRDSPIDTGRWMCVIVEIFTGSHIRRDTIAGLIHRRHRRDSMRKYMALMRKCVDDTSIN